MRLVPFVNPAQFNSINEAAIARAVLKTRGADADQRRRMLISKNYATVGKDLRTAIANAARKLCTVDLAQDNAKNLSTIEAYTACRLIPLEKKGNDVRPIGVGEVLRRIVGKSVVGVIKPDILESAGSLQLCAGHMSGCEAAVHAMTEIYEDASSDGLLLVDAANAFNALNRNVLLHNIAYLCPPMCTYLATVIARLRDCSSQAAVRSHPLKVLLRAVR